MLSKKTFYCFFLILPIMVAAQERKTGPEQDCPGALPICSDFFTQSSSYNGWGQNHSELPANSCLITNETNSVWYIFNTSNAGFLEMILSPLGTDDYDFALFDITGHTCADIATGVAPEVLCNYTLNDQTTGNGLTTGFGHGGSGTSSPPGGPSFNEALTINSSPHTYVLLVNNFTTSKQGYTLDFRGSTTNIVDTVKPKVIAISNSICDSATSVITIKLSRPVLCSSIIADGSQFTVTGPAPVVVDSAYDVDCSTGIYSIYVNVRLKNPITLKGDYSLNTQQSTFGIRLMDICDHELDDTSIIYHQYAILKPAFTWTYISACQVDTVVFANVVTPNDSTYLWEFGDGTTSTSATPPNHVYPDTANYQVTLVSYSGSCADSITQTVHVGRTFYDSIFAPDSVCQGTLVQFTDKVAGGTSTQFYYDFGDQPGGDLLAQVHNPTHTFINPGIDTVKLIVTQSPENSVCNFTALKVIVVDSLNKANFVISPQVVCQGTPGTFTDASSGAPTAWLWNFGNGATSANQSVSYTYDSIGTFDVTLQVSNVCNTTDTGLSITVKKVPAFSLGPDTAICRPDSILLVAFPNADSILWSTGDTTPFIFVKNVPQDIHVRVVQNGCPFETSRKINEKEDGCIDFLVPTAFSPNGDGVNDVFRLVNPERVQDVDIKIFNRWGQMVYHGTSVNYKWDGTFNGEKAPLDVYTWFAEVTGLSGENEFRKGNVTLVR